MARLLAARALAMARPSGTPSALRFCPSRALSDEVEFVEIDLSEESPVSSSGGEGAGDSATVQAQMGSRRLEDAIHGVLVRRAAPEWLPFVPGASYWVPPFPRPLGVTSLLGAAVYTARGAAAMTEEEAFSFTTVRGCPSAAYFVGGREIRWWTCIFITMLLVISILKKSAWRLVMYLFHIEYMTFPKVVRVSGLLRLQSVQGQKWKISASSEEIEGRCNSN